MQIQDSNSFTNKCFIAPKNIYLKFVKGILLYHDKIYINFQSPFKQVHLEEFHAIPMVGHAEIHRSYGRLSDHFFWKGMKKRRG